MATLDIRGTVVGETATAIKAPCLVATTGANIALSGIQTIDGIPVGNNAERVLVKDQTTQSQNGIYIASTGSWVLAADWTNNANVVYGTLVLTITGAINGGVLFIQTCADSPIIIGTSLIVFVPLANATAQAAASETSNTVGTGAMTFAVPTGKAFSAKQYVVIYETSNASNSMLAQITSYSGTSLVVNVIASSGSGTHADWSIVLTNSPASAGIVPPIGSGNVIGPGSSTAGHIAKFSDATGKTLEDVGPLLATDMTFTQAGSGAATITLDAKLKQFAISVIDFGADPSDTTDSSAAFNNAYAEAISLNKPLYIPAGSYRVSSQLAWDVHPRSLTGITIIGDGAHMSILDFSQDSVASPNLRIYDSVTEPVVYCRIGAFGVKANVNGVAVQIGQTNFSDAWNVCRFGPMYIANTNSGTSAVGLQVNEVLSSTFECMVANLNGAGTGMDAIQLNQSIMNTFSGCSAGNSAIGLHLTNGYSYGNVFLGLDLENATSGVAIDTPDALDNTWIGGSAANLSYFANGSAGNGNYFFNINLSAIAVSKLNGATGIFLSNPGNSYITTPSVPASGTALTNSSGQRAVVHISGGSVTAVKVNGVTPFSNTNVTVILNPGDTITLTYSSAPSWVWLQLY